MVKMHYLTSCHTMNTYFVFLQTSSLSKLFINIRCKQWRQSVVAKLAATQKKTHCHIATAKSALTAIDNDDEANNMITTTYSEAMRLGRVIGPSNDTSYWLPYPLPSITCLPPSNRTLPRSSTDDRLLGVHLRLNVASFIASTSV